MAAERMLGRRWAVGHMCVGAAPNHAFGHLNRAAGTRYPLNKPCTPPGGARAEGRSPTHRRPAPEAAGGALMRARRCLASA